MYIILALLAVPVLLLALIGLRYLIRGTPVRRIRSASLREAGIEVHDPAFGRQLELLTQLRFTDDNSAELLYCGNDMYSRLFADLSGARRSITLQMYYCNPGRLAYRLQEVLCERARAGVQVLTLWDAFGSQGLSDEYRETLRAAGVQVAVFRPVEWYALEKAYNRSHIRVITVDARVGYTGGFGVDDKWLGDGRHADQWRDTTVRFEGPSVLELQATFAAGWAEATGDLLVGPPFFEHADGRGAECEHAEEDRPAGEGAARRSGIRAGVMHAAPTLGSTVAERFLALVISGARETLRISNAYFVPDDDFCDLLERAAKRGTDVRILVPGPNTDVRSTRMASHARYEQLLTAGVRLFEYQPTMMHAKTIVADGLLGAVGTMNFDNRSMAFNDESNFIFLNPDLAGDLMAAFERDMQVSQEVRLEAFLHRPWTERVQERGFDLLSRIL